MGKGQQLGLELRQWLENGSTDLHAPQVLANRWSDALGSDETLKAPLRDLASRPLFRQGLRQTGMARRTSLEQLARELAGTYSPQVLSELLDLLEGFAQISLQRPAPSSGAGAPPRRQLAARLTLVRKLRPMAAGIALAAAAALVWMWIGAELDRLLFEDWGWSGGTVLVVGLAGVEGLLLGPLRQRRQTGLLTSELADDSGHAWRWVTAPWVHGWRGDALLNLIVLAVILGESALQLPDVLLRYALTSLATLIPVALLNPATAPRRRWGGASGAVGALIGLGVTMSALQGRGLTYTLGVLSIPAWVLLLIHAGLQLSWLARERRSTQDRPDPWRDLLASPWCWGMLYGTGWALLTWLLQLLETLRNSAQA
ncbi:MAG: rhomboid family intramembrane serine protease [Cyanobium sp.]|nr:rhomboid family intramembrane serine protease [Cyanobium sp.]